MKLKVFVQGANMVDSPVVGVGKVCAITARPVDEEAAKRAGLAPQTAVSFTVLDPAKFPLGSEREITL